MKEMTKHRHLENMKAQRMIFLDAIMKEGPRNGRRNYDESIEGDSPRQSRLVTSRPKYPVMFSNVLLLGIYMIYLSTKKCVG